MSALSLLRSRLSIDLDQFSPELAERYGPFSDMTSNPAVLAGLIARDTEVEHVRRVIARARLEAGDNSDEAVEMAMDMLVVSLSKITLPHLTGRVHAQISPRHALSTSSTLAHAHRLMRLFAQDGISPGRVCLQIPCTGAGMAAAAQLEKSGIRTLATTVFSVDQARAAADAGCLYVAPYWNEFAVQFQPASWVAYSDPAKDHPMAKVIAEIVDVCALREEGTRPLVMVMNMVNPKEALAVSTLGVDHVSLSGNVIEDMAGDGEPAAYSNGRSGKRDRDDDEDQNTGSNRNGIINRGESKGGNGEDSHEGRSLNGNVGEERSKGKGKSRNIDWLADEGWALDESIRSDEKVSMKLEYAINSFEECEARVAHVFRQMMTIS